MKKLVLTIAFAMFSIIASAYFQKTSLVSFPTDSIINSLDSIQNNHNYQKLHRIAFYDVDRIVVNNKKKQYIKIENAYGEIIVETIENIDIKVPAGTYYVYSNAKKTSAYYKQY